IAHHMPADDYWFPGRRGTSGPIRGRAVSDLIRVAKRRAGITDPTLTAHSLRHSFGTHLVEAGVNVRVIQELMLHEDLSSTQLYTGVSQDLKAAGIAMLSATPIPRQSGRRARVGSGKELRYRREDVERWLASTRANVTPEG